MIKAVKDIMLYAVWFPALVFIVNLIGWFLKCYDLWPAFDIPMHILGGISITYFFWKTISILETRKIILPIQGIIKVIFIFSLTCTITVLWEFAEFTLDHIIAHNVQLGLDDTLLDMLLGIVGAIIFLAGIHCFRLIKAKSLQPEKVQGNKDERWVG